MRRGKKKKKKTIPSSMSESHNQHSNTQRSAESTTKQAQTILPQPRIDVRLLDQQLADCDSDEFSDDEDLHTGGCGCCAGSVGQIRQN